MNDWTDTHRVQLIWLALALSVGALALVFYHHHISGAVKLGV